MPIIKSTNFVKLTFELLLKAAFTSTTTPAVYRYNADENTSQVRIYREFARRPFTTPMITIGIDPGDVSMRYLGNEEVSNVYRIADELVVSDKLAYTPVALISSVYKGATTYVEDTDFTVNKQTGVFTWIITNPTGYSCTYDTISGDKLDAPMMGRWVQSQLRVPVRLTVYALNTTDRERLIDLVSLYVRHVFREMLSSTVTYIDMRLGGEGSTEWDNQVLFTHTLTVDCWAEYAHYIDESTFALISQINITNIGIY